VVGDEQTPGGAGFPELIKSSVVHGRLGYVFIVLRMQDHSLTLVAPYRAGRISKRRATSWYP
jgi:hypothetical protein